jgi:hypothetical protein
MVKIWLWYPFIDNYRNISSFNNANIFLLSMSRPVVYSFVRIQLIILLWYLQWGKKRTYIHLYIISNYSKAKLMLRKKKFQESLLEKTDGQLDNIDRMVKTFFFNYYYLFLVHLDQRSRWTIAITWRPSSVKFSHFKLLLRNHWADWNQT